MLGESAQKAYATWLTRAPTKPKDHGAQYDQRQAVRIKGLAKRSGRPKWTTHLKGLLKENNQTLDVCHSRE